MKSLKKKVPHLLNHFLWVLSELFQIMVQYEFYFIKLQLIDFALQLHKCNHLFSTRENGTLESPYLPAGNGVTSPNHHQFLNEMDSTPVKQTNSFSRNTKGKILVSSLTDEAFKSLKLKKRAVNIVRKKMNSRTCNEV